MLASSLTNYEFSLVAKNSTKIFTNNFVLRISQSEDNQLKYAAVVSRKIANSVKRNLIKRRFRHIIKDFSHTDNSKSFALIFYPKKNILDLSFAKLQNQLNYEVNKFLKS